MDEHGSRVLGCLFGGAIGDCVGSSIEGASYTGSILDLPWQWTDDTQLTVATCEAIIQSGKPDPAAIAERMCHWYASGRVSGLGASAKGALDALKAGAHWALAGISGEYAAGNGAAMRIAPVAFFVDPFDYLNRRTIRDICRITHKSEEAYAAALAVVLALRGELDRYEDPLPHVVDHLPDSRTRDAIAGLDGLGRGASVGDAARLVGGSSGFAAESVPLALFGAVRATDIGIQAVLEELAQVQFWLSMLELNIPPPGISDLIFWGGGYFGDGDDQREMTAEEILASARDPRTGPRVIELGP